MPCPAKIGRAKSLFARRAPFLAFRFAKDNRAAKRARPQFRDIPSAVVSRHAGPWVDMRENAGRMCPVWWKNRAFFHCLIDPEAT
jgi:hypothetical protein